MPTRPSLTKPAILLATWFGSGYLKPAPGTWGTAAALPVAWVLIEYTGTIGLLAATVATFCIGVWAANVFDAESGGHDSSEIVIDEAAGLFCTYGLVSIQQSIDPMIFFFGFVLFRVFDILKPFPIRQLDASVPGGLGVMVDDILAAAYAALGCIVAGMLIQF